MVHGRSEKVQGSICSERTSVKPGSSKLRQHLKFVTISAVAKLWFVHSSAKVSNNYSYSKSYIVRIICTYLESSGRFNKLGIDSERQSDDCFFTPGNLLN